MPLISRRSFSAWLAALAPAAALSRTAWGARLGLSRGTHDETIAPRSPLDEPMVLALAATILPSELGKSGLERAAADFQRWLGAYKAGAELIHGYGTGTINSSPPDPRAKWASQLTALGDVARSRFAKTFPSLTVDERRTLVREAIAGERLDRMPSSPIQASHVAVAMLARYFGSSEAMDVCYQRRIGKNQCRPLAESPKEPAPLAPRA